MPYSISSDSIAERYFCMLLYGNSDILKNITNLAFMELQRLYSVLILLLQVWYGASASMSYVARVVYQFGFHLFISFMYC